MIFVTTGAEKSNLEIKNPIELNFIHLSILLLLFIAIYSYKDKIVEDCRKYLGIMCVVSNISVSIRLARDIIKSLENTELLAPYILWAAF